ncbi:hypothetical protein GUITHDRAFT_138005 [Guillardia theta CCMP2712]|uniref:Uncharacterized protein n=1 Tax=Guillardia theta (strain CCMP2712) TaxID=905079 RepID=L1JEP9_GUITC|nr:hypothetical protein GUITHDRAFT_138005 [Guillardia theta CCMP2712]EKX46614.1 hypothetical protein GUITHDRAFT_138005 [Guillardia theta CCMP2712]|eukprot:XP_005833594.1 hypothetical protein GUITHDRAFT_138005 [Guillardia theta CCMP2712]
MAKRIGWWGRALPILMLSFPAILIVTMALLKRVDATTPVEEENRKLGRDYERGKQEIENIRKKIEKQRRILNTERRLASRAEERLKDGETINLAKITNFYTSPPKPWWQHGVGIEEEDLTLQNGDPTDAMRSNSPMLVPVQAGDVAAADESSEASRGWGSSSFAEKTGQARGRATDDRRGRDLMDANNLSTKSGQEGTNERRDRRSNSLWSDMRSLLKDTLRMERDKDAYSKARKEEAER